jgi:hypothetical protein
MQNSLTEIKKMREQGATKAYNLEMIQDFFKH